MTRMARIFEGSEKIIDITKRSLFVIFVSFVIKKQVSNSTNLAEKLSYLVQYVGN